MIRTLRAVLSPALKRAYPILNIAGISIENGLQVGPHMQDAIMRGVYEQPEIGILIEHLVPDDRLLEIGACLGVLSAVAARRLGPGRVTTYEANPDLYDVIEKTWSSNNVSATLQRSAVGSVAGTLDLFVGDESWASSAVRSVRRRQHLQVPMVALNDAIAAHRPTFLVVDIEGGEVSLFDGADLKNVRAILIETHAHIVGTNNFSFRRLFANLGFVMSQASKDNVELWVREQDG